MGINLLRDLGYADDSVVAKKARESARIYEDVINGLVACREEAGLKQKEVAKRMGTQQSAVSELENLASDARFSTILRYAHAVGAEIDIEITPAGKAYHSEKPDWVSLRVNHSGGLRVVEPPQTSTWKTFRSEPVNVANFRPVAAGTAA
ncbi:helix-turn-helix domain-containing protein [Leifsonia shinshuensis]|uniref:Transcriptional regulator with XRE-family HTH domain n=1 Tax=Leifsonia shinshuensis TaxID=150026 RepID=A0A853CY88_9MICO|nr:helix-turn-helix domain-containing protein [Leifsonia shinshuensis]NYJ24883.1 transcriptional regulator with XRE-family HTH domain [Leifsonia shinshuensis]